MTPAPATDPIAAADPASSTGLTARTAGTLAYLAGPFSGALLLLVEETSVWVRFHAWQAVLGLGALGALSVLSLGTAFLLVMVSTKAFWTMLWMAAATAVAWVGLWAACLVQAYRGRRWKMPLAGAYAERLSALPGTSSTNLRAPAAP